MMDTLGHSDAPAACIVMKGSERAGPFVVVNADIHHLPVNPAAVLGNIKARSRPAQATLQQKACDVSVTTQCPVYSLKHQPTGETRDPNLHFTQNMRISGEGACMLRASNKATT